MHTLIKNWGVGGEEILISKQNMGNGEIDGRRGGGRAGESLLLPLIDRSDPHPPPHPPIGTSCVEGITKTHNKRRRGEGLRCLRQMDGPRKGEDERTRGRVDLVWRRRLARFWVKWAEQKMNEFGWSGGGIEWMIGREVVWREGKGQSSEKAVGGGK